MQGVGGWGVSEIEAVLLQGRVQPSVKEYSGINHSGDSNLDEECDSTAPVGYTQEAVNPYTSVTLQVGFI
jgi:hypothetical protein